MRDTVSLKAYVAHVENLLNGNAVDEAIHHCRHILQYYPKHIETYRLLGRAMLFASRWDEAGAALRRVLSVIPDDFVAHIGLHEVYLEQNRPTDAIWHLERAYEHDPNNTEIIDSLRELYKRYRNTDQQRIQLTAAAVARQYARNGLYEQAANTLRNTITRMPDRLDLRALLAETLWGAELRIEAAETALDVLAQLPDCLSANRILAELWLREDRPSDAQRYVNRIEAVDPYLALEVATGQPAPEDAYQLEELDYHQMAQSELTNEQPDWLSQLGGLSYGAETGTGSQPESEWSSLLKKTKSEPTPPKPSVHVEEPKVTPKAAEPAEELPDASDLLDDGIPDWLTDINVAQQAAQKQTGSLHQEFEELNWTFVPSDEDEPPEATTDVAARDLRRETATHASIAKKKPFEEEKEELPDWLTSTAEESPASEEAEPEADDPLAWLNQPLDDSAGEPEAPKASTNPLAWLEEAGIEVDENAQRQRFVFDSGDEDVKIAPEKVDPLAWMQDSGIELDEDETPDEFQFDAEQASDDDDDPLAWMRESGVEMTGGDEEAPSLSDFMDAPEKADDEDAMAWLQEFDEAEPAEAGSQDAPLFDWVSDDEIPESFAQLDEAEAGSSTADEEDALDWLQDQSLSEYPPTTPNPLETTEAESGWMMNDDDTSLGTRFDASPDKATQLLSGDALEPTRATFEEADILDEGLFAEAHSEAAAQQTPDSQRDIATVSDLTDRQEDMSDKDDKTPDWRDSEQAGKPDDANDWLDSFSFDEDESVEPAAESDIPEWLAELGPNYVHPESLPAQPAHQADKDAFELAGDELQMESVEPADIPDWLTEAQPQTAAPQVEPEAPGEFEWMSDELQMESVEPADVPDWLTEAQPQASAPQAEPEAAGEFEWMSDLSADEEEEEIQPADVPDWLTEVQPPISAPQAETESPGEFEWMSDLRADDEKAESTVPETPTIPAQEEPDWAAHFEETSASDMPEWLSELQPEAPAPAEAEAKDEWEAEFELEEADASEDTPEWLQAISEESKTEVEVPGEIAAEFEWQTELEDAAHVETVQPGEQPDWLSELSTEAEVPEAKPATEAEFGWLIDDEEATEPAAEIETEPEIEHPPATNAPDWLNAMVPGVDLDYTPAEDEPVETEFAEGATHRTRTTPEQAETPIRDFQWVVDIVEEETAQVVPAAAMVPPPAPPEALPETPAEAPEPQRPRFQFSKPPAWKRGKQSEASSMADWPSDTNDDNGELDLPDWLK